ncbi:hypothetical protein M8C21_011725 [Ambrosia artemisiifolia]|uniref:Uncharacterized protein n=1 Tax=Ambrosia artemisiifolia TaxID=4212 RepID=A0AAD5CDY0_AMBAR|nr:hypothetical protein M8C21_011725 [Ambrosia artemisiifolia]
MAPKAEKKPAEKKPAEDKAPAEKKPKAGKKLPKEAGSAAVDKKKKRHKKSVETYKIYIFKVLKQNAYLAVAMGVLCNYYYAFSMLVLQLT